MDHGDQTKQTEAAKPELHNLYRPLAIKAVAAAALMLKRKKPAATPA